MVAFVACTILLNNYVVLPYLSVWGLAPVPIPQEIWLLFTAVMGVAAWTRGQEKIAALNNGNGKGPNGQSAPASRKSLYSALGG